MARLKKALDFLRYLSAGDAHWESGSSPILEIRTWRMQRDRDVCLVLTQGLLSASTLANRQRRAPLR